VSPPPSPALESAGGEENPPPPESVGGKRDPPPPPPESVGSEGNPPVVQQSDQAEGSGTAAPTAPEEGQIEETADDANYFVDKEGKEPPSHLFQKGGHLYQEHSAAKLPDASFLDVNCVFNYSLTAPPRGEMTKCPKYLTNRSTHITRESRHARFTFIQSQKALHDRICRKYLTASLDAENPSGKARINRELRKAVHSHAECWQWERGGMDSHLSSLKIKDLQEMVRALHSASLKFSEGFYQETSGDEVLLSSTWNCNADRGLISPGADISRIHAGIRKWLDIPLPEGHAYKGKGGGKGKGRWTGDRFLPPSMFKDSPCTIPTHFYYDVYKEMAAAELYKREVLKK